jgi:hypothetical protein
LANLPLKHVGPDPPERGQVRVGPVQENKNQHPYTNPARGERIGREAQMEQLERIACKEIAKW